MCSHGRKCMHATSTSCRRSGGPMHAGTSALRSGGFSSLPHEILWMYALLYWTIPMHAVSTMSSTMPHRSNGHTIVWVQLCKQELHRILPMHACNVISQLKSDQRHVLVWLARPLGRSSKLARLSHVHATGSGHIYSHFSNKTQLACMHIHAIWMFDVFLYICS